MNLDTSCKRQWIDLAHDVTFGDAELAVREGYVSVEHFKRYTTTGMSVDQGKTGNLNAFIVLGALTGKPTGEVGTTTFRPPYTPVTLGAIAGRNIGEFYAPRRYLPAHRRTKNCTPVSRIMAGNGRIIISRKVKLPTTPSSVKSECAHARWACSIIHRSARSKFAAPMRQNS